MRDAYLRRFRVVLGAEDLYHRWLMTEFVSGVAIQDDALFRDWRLSDEQALAVVDGVLAAVRPFAGLVVVNTHPIHIRDHPHFYRQLTTLLASTSWIRVLCTGELVRRLDAVTSRDVA